MTEPINWIDIERFIIDLVDGDVPTPEIKEALKDKFKWTDKQAAVAYRSIVG